jgi:hypothetical protein
MNYASRQRRDEQIKREVKIDKSEGESVSRYTRLPRIGSLPSPNTFHLLPPRSIIIILQIKVHVREYPLSSHEASYMQSPMGETSASACVASHSDGG